MIKVLQSGLLTTIQDMGRFGFRNMGVPISGAMDHISAGMANALLDNDKNDAVMEITLSGPKLAFTAITNFVISGAEMSPNLNDNLLINNKIYTSEVGDILSFGNPLQGVRCYLAVRGGIQSEVVLGSRSYYRGITKSSSIKKNDDIPISAHKQKKTGQIGLIKSPSFYKTDLLEVFYGPDYGLFEKDKLNELLDTSFNISGRNNRMGVHLKEKVLQHQKSIITGPVIPGTVQLTPSGTMIVLMKDAQTTGGYPRIFQLTNRSIAILAQKREGERIRFKIRNKNK